MNIRLTRSMRSRLARLEAAMAKRPKSPRFVPTEQADLFRFLCEEYAKPAMIIPSARALLGAFAACCACFPEEGQADLGDPDIAGRLPALRQELLAFLEVHLETEFYEWRYSMAWTELALARFDVRVGARERGPTAQQWCDGLSELELVFEAVGCLFSAHIRVQDWLLWLDKRESGLELWESVRLPEEEEETLLAELGVDSAEKAASISKAAWEKCSPKGNLHPW